MASTKQRRPRSFIVRLLRALAIVILIVLLLPYALAPVYRFVDPVSTLMVWRRLTGARVERTVVPINAMAPSLPLTVITSEDGRFCTHHGVDFQEMREALEDAEDFDDLR